MQTHRGQFSDDRTTPGIGRREKIEKDAAKDPNPVNRAVYRQWLYQDKIAVQTGLGGDDLDDIEFAALSGDSGPSLR